MTKIAFVLPAGSERARDDRLYAKYGGFVVNQELQPASLLTIAGCTPPSVECEYFDERREPLEYSRLTEFDIVALTGLSTMARDIYRIADRLKPTQVKTICGGPHATVAPDEVGEHVDCVVTMQGEAVWPQILADFNAGSLKKQYMGNWQQFDEQMPLPRWELLRKYRGLEFTPIVITSWGCPLDCEFCSEKLIHGSKIRWKSPEMFRNELQNLCELFVWDRSNDQKMVRVTVGDDNFFTSPKRTRQYVQIFSEFPVLWNCQGTINIKDENELLDALVQSGCMGMQIGFESIYEETLRQLDPRNRKHLSDYKDAIRKIQSKGLAVRGSFVIYDNDPESVFDDLYTFGVENELTQLQVQVAQPLPGTRLYERLKSEGRMLYEPPWDTIPVSRIRPILQPGQMSVDRMERGILDLNRRYFAGKGRSEALRGLAEQFAERRRSLRGDQSDLPDAIPLSRFAGGS